MRVCDLCFVETWNDLSWKESSRSFHHTASSYGRWNEVQRGLTIYAKSALLGGCTCPLLVLTQFPPISKWQASCVLVPPTHAWSRRITVSWSTKVPKVFTSTAVTCVWTKVKKELPLILPLILSMYFAFQCLGSMLEIWGYWPWWPLGSTFCDYVYGLFTVVLEFWDPCSISLALSLGCVLTWLTFHVYYDIILAKQ